MSASTATGWNSDGALIAPSALNSLSEGRSFYSGFFRPVDQKHSFAINSYNPVGPSVASLFFFSRPFNISDLIVSVVVIPINAVLGRRPKPNIVNHRIDARNEEFNASSSVALKSLCLGVFAALFGAPKCFGFWRFGKAVRGIFFANANNPFKAPTPARLSLPLKKRLRLDGTFVPTVAAAKPFGRFSAYQAKDQVFAESPAFEIVESRSFGFFKKNGSVLNSHDRFSIKRFWLGRFAKSNLRVASVHFSMLNAKVE